MSISAIAWEPGRHCPHCGGAADRAQGIYRKLAYGEPFTQELECRNGHSWFRASASFPRRRAA
jgi:hypothetical protein